MEKLFLEGDGCVYVKELLILCVWETEKETERKGEEEEEEKVEEVEEERVKQRWR